MQWYRTIRASREELWAYLAQVDPWIESDLAKYAAQNVSNITLYDVVLVSKINIGTSNEQRPCLVTGVLGNNKYQVAPITGHLELGDRFKHPDDMLVMDYQRAGLIKPSIILGTLFEVDGSLIRRKLFHLSGEILDQYLEHTGREPIQPVYTRPQQEKGAPKRPS